MRQIEDCFVLSQEWGYKEGEGCGKEGEMRERQKDDVRLCVHGEGSSLTHLDLQ